MNHPRMFLFNAVYCWIAAIMYMVIHMNTVDELIHLSNGAWIGLTAMYAVVFWISLLLIQSMINYVNKYSLRVSLMLKAILLTTFIVAFLSLKGESGSILSGFLTIYFLKEAIYDRVLKVVQMDV